jgi:hypothetical protein
MRKSHFQLVGGNAQSVAEKPSLFCEMKPGISISLRGLRRLLAARRFSLASRAPYGLSLSSQNGWLDRRELLSSHGCETNRGGRGHSTVIWFF